MDENLIWWVFAGGAFGWWRGWRRLYPGYERQRAMVLEGPPGPERGRVRGQILGYFLVGCIVPAALGSIIGASVWLLATLLLGWLSA